MSTIVIGWDEGTYTPNVGTRQITLSGLGFTPSVTGLLYVHNYTQDTTYFAQAQSYGKSITFTADASDWILEYQDLSTFDPLGADDIIHIQFAGYQSLATESKQDAIISALGGSIAYDTLVDDYTTTDITYVGNADMGTATNSALWQIYRLNETGDYLEKGWADSNENFDNIWDNRVSLSYSR